MIELHGKNRSVAERGREKSVAQLVGSARVTAYTTLCSQSGQLSIYYRWPRWEKVQEDGGQSGKMVHLVPQWAEGCWQTIAHVFRASDRGYRAVETRPRMQSENQGFGCEEAL